MTAPTDPCAHCGHPHDGHGTRYAALPGRHEWAAAPRPVTPFGLTPPAHRYDPAESDAFDPIANLRATLSWLSAFRPARPADPSARGIGGARPHGVYVDEVGQMDST